MSLGTWGDPAIEKKPVRIAPPFNPYVPVVRGIQRIQDGEPVRLIMQSEEFRGLAQDAACSVETILTAYWLAWNRT